MAAAISAVPPSLGRGWDERRLPSLRNVDYRSGLFQVCAGTCTAAKTTERLSPGFGSGKRGSGPLGNHAGLMFGDGGKDVDGKTIGLREMKSNASNSTMASVGLEANVRCTPFSGWEYGTGAGWRGL